MPPGNPYQPGIYYDPNNPYGANQNYATAPIVGGPGGFLDENPQAAYLRIIAPFASGNDPFSQFVRSEYSRAFGGYNAARATNPNLGFGWGPADQDYGKGLNENFFRSIWNNRSAAQRGLNAPQFGAGRTQWQRQFL